MAIQTKSSNTIKSGPYGIIIESTTGVNFHSDHYMKVNRARQATTDLPTRKDYYDDQDTGEIPDHELLGTILKKKSTGGEYVIDKVCRQWYMGWYWVVLARAKGTKSHATLLWENESCRNETIVEGIGDTAMNWETTGEQITIEEMNQY